MTVLPADKCRQLGGLGRIVIHTAHQAVFKGHAASGLFKVIMTCIKNFVKFVHLRDGHEAFPYPVVGRMERKGQRKGYALFGQSPDAGHDARFF